MITDEIEVLDLSESVNGIISTTERYGALCGVDEEVFVVEWTEMLGNFRTVDFLILGVRLGFRNHLVATRIPQLRGLCI